MLLAPTTYTAYSFFCPSPRPPFSASAPQPSLVTISNLVAENNLATRGGAIFVGTSAPPIRITESLFSSNNALDLGGALCVQLQPTEELDVPLFGVGPFVYSSNNTFVNNGARLGGAAYVGGFAAQTLSDPPLSAAMASLTNFPAAAAPTAAISNAPSPLVVGSLDSVLALLSTYNLSSLTADPGLRPAGPPSLVAGNTMSAASGGSGSTTAPSDLFLDLDFGAMSGVGAQTMDQLRSFLGSGVQPSPSPSSSPPSAGPLAVKTSPFALTLQLQPGDQLYEGERTHITSFALRQVGRAMITEEGLDEWVSRDSAAVLCVLVISFVF